MDEHIGPQLGDIVLACPHKAEDGRWHHYDMSSIRQVRTVEVDGIERQPTWAILCTNCHMDQRVTSEKVTRWFQWEENMVSPKAVVAN